MIDRDSCVLWLDSRYFTESYWWDRSRYRNNGVIHGVKWETNSFYFDGSNDYIDCGNHESLDITDALTVIAWVKKGNSGDYTIASKYQTANNKRSWILRLNSDDKIVFTISPDGTYTLAKTIISLNIIDNRVHCIAGRYKDTHMNIFIDGKKESVQDDVSAIYSSDVHVCIGRYIDGYYYKGNIYSVIIFDKGLSDSEIEMITNLTYRRI